MMGVKWFGFKRMDKALKADAMRTTLNKHMRRATVLNAKVAEAALRRSIRNGDFTPNRALTIAIKGSTKPLVDRGESLFQAATSKVVNDNTVFVGILQTDGAYNIAKLLHDGGKIAVSEKMRGLFYVLWRASEGDLDPSELTGRAAELWERMPGGWKPLAESTRVILIPSRPFVRRAFENAALKAKLRGNWRMAVQAAIKERAEQGDE